MKTYDIHLLTKSIINEIFSNRFCSDGLYPSTGDFLIYLPRRQEETKVKINANHPFFLLKDQIQLNRCLPDIYHLYIYLKSLS